MIDRLIEQLDTLVPFLGLAHEEVFDLIHSENEEWFPPKQRATLPETFSGYTSQVSISAFLLGYSYFEAYIADLAKEVLKNRPSLLPKDKKVTYSEIIESGNYESIFDHIIEQQVFSVMYSSLENIAKYFEKSLHLKWPTNNGTYSFVEASLVRNCLMHNGGIVDKRLSELDGWNGGSKIILSPDNVHDYGIELRSLAYELYEQADSKHLAKACSN